MVRPGAASENLDAPPGKERKYARPELERRFLLATWPPGEPVRRVRIEDRYITGTRLRLRRMTDLADGSVTRKLAQKIPGPDGGPGLITNLYLSEAEHAALSTLPAVELRKTRASFPPFGVDTFEGPLRGLILAEAEFHTERERDAFSPAIPHVAEVTRDEELTGDRLARMHATELRLILARYGIHTSGSADATSCGAVG